MVNFETIDFIDRLNEFAERTECGIFPFSTATPEMKDGVLYDDTTLLEESDEYCKRFPIIADCLIDNEHHDIVSTYDNMYKGIQLYVEIQRCDDVVDVSIAAYSKRDDILIVIEDGEWYIVR